jgi:cysteinyl-tRNA synthetase
MFSCGPSIYQRPHIGNYRTFLFEDILQRYLEYTGYKVTRALNFTDVEDKSILEAKKRNMELPELTNRNAVLFFEDLAFLKIKPPTYNPKSSTSVDQSVFLIEELLKKDQAYWHKGNVYFDPLTFKGFGKLSHIDMSRYPHVKRRFHKDTYPGNNWNLGDFILWHGTKKGDTVFWDTAIGRGRPAWNVQDPAMVTQTLGFSIDIFCGGVDNLVRHHDYVIALTESVSGNRLSNYWLHGAHLLVNGKKMSKSKGNIVYIDDILKAGYSREDIRFFLMYRHYRRKLNFNDDKINRSSRKLERAREMIGMIQRSNTDKQKSIEKVVKLIPRLKLDFEKNMDNDLDVKNAFDGLFKTLSILAEYSRKNLITQNDKDTIIAILRNIDDVFQVFGIS